MEDGIIILSIIGRVKLDSRNTKRQPKPFSVIPSLFQFLVTFVSVGVMV